MIEVVRSGRATGRSGSRKADSTFGTKLELVHCFIFF